MSGVLASLTMLIEFLAVALIVVILSWPNFWHNVKGHIALLGACIAAVIAGSMAMHLGYTSWPFSSAMDAMCLIGILEILYLRYLYTHRSRRDHQT